MVGQTVSHYDIVEKLGEGGMGVVYKARDRRLDRFVALKFLTGDVGADSEEWTRFLQEARAASNLDHQNICPVYDVGTTPDGRMFIVMPHCAGQTLRSLMGRGAMPLGDALSIARQVADGLAVAHPHGVVHRDIKPSNVIVTEQDVAKIVDFGVAKLMDATRVTATGSTIGTVGYMASEQVRDSAVDGRADVWGVGIILYELLAGRPASRGRTSRSCRPSSPRIACRSTACPPRRRRSCATSSRAPSRSRPMVRQRGRGAALHSRRRMAGPALSLRRAGCPIRLRSRGGERLPDGEIRRSRGTRRRNGAGILGRAPRHEIRPRRRR